MTLEKDVLFRLRADDQVSSTVDQIKQRNAEMRREIKQLNDELATFGSRYKGALNAFNDAYKGLKGSAEAGKMAIQQALLPALRQVNAELALYVDNLVKGAEWGGKIAGPLGAIAGAAGAFIGTHLGDYFGETDRAAAAAARSYINAMAALNRWEDAVEQGSKKAQELIDRQRAADPAIGGVTRALNAQTDAWVKARGAVTSYSIALLQLQVDKARQIGQGRSVGVTSEEIQLGRRIRDASLEQDAAISPYGDVLKEVYGKRNREGDRKKDAAAALRDGKITRAEYIAYIGAKAPSEELLDPDDFSSYGARRRIVGEFTSDVYRANSSIYDMASPNAANENAAVTAFIEAQRRAFTAGSRGLNSPYAQQGDGIRAAQKSQLERMFGPLQEFNAYATAFDTLSGAASAALTAWIDGSMSAGKAFKLFIGDALKALASQLLIEGLKHGAYALGSLAFGDVGGAARHGAAAAAFLAGSGAAAVAARSIGTSAQASATSSSSGSAARVGGAAANGNEIGGRERVVVYEDSFVEANAHQRARRARRALQRAGGGRQTVRAA